LNTAALELQQVPGIAPTTADKILQMRKSYGPLKSVDDSNRAVSVIVVELVGTLKLMTASVASCCGREPR
jgi:DNA uptake protein ComE-like DNA-binding protein